LRIEADRADAANANFYFAICALTPPTGASAFVHVPRTANMLREREMHIATLEGRNKQLGGRLVKVQAELEISNTWSAQLDADLSQTRQRVVEVQDELAAQQRAAQQSIDNLQRRFTHDIGEANKHLDEAHQTIEERTKWALDQEAWARSLEAELATIRRSIWYRLGRKFGLRLGSKPGEEAGGPPPQS
jgi:hypothetical protein